MASMATGFAFLAASDASQRAAVRWKVAANDTQTGRAAGLSSCRSAAKGFFMAFITAQGESLSGLAAVLARLVVSRLVASGLGRSHVGCTTAFGATMVSTAGASLVPRKRGGRLSFMAARTA